MFRSRALLASLVTTLWLVAPHAAGAQTVTLRTTGATGTITANGGAVTIADTGGMTSLLIQTVGTFSLTWEAQCAGDGTTFDQDDEIPVTLVSSSPTPADSVATNVEGLYTATIAGCRAVRVIATAYTSGTMTVSLTATPTGGGSSSGGGAASSVSIAQGGNTAAVNASSQLSVTCANCSGAGVSQLEDTAFVDGGATTPAGTMRQDTIASTTSTDGDVSVIKSDSVGRIYVTGTGGTFATSGTAATDAAVSGNPVYTAGRASAAAPTDVSADGDVVPPWLLRSGAQVVQPTYAGVLSVAGNGASGTGVQRVTIANDSTGVLASIGSITGAITLPTGAASAANQSTEITSLQLIDDPVTTLGTTTYTEASSKGFTLNAVRRDADTTLVDTTNEMAPLQVNAGGQLKVACIAGCSGSTFADNAAFTFGTTVISPIGGVFDDASSNTATENSAAVARITANKALHVNLRTAAGVEITPATDVVEDVAETGGGTGPLVMNVRRDALASSSGTSGDHSTFNTTSNGALWVAQPDPCSFGTKVFVNITQTTGTQLLTGTASNRTYVCSIHIISATAQNIALVSGTGTVCATGIAGMAGGTTAATGWNLAANSGLVLGGSNAAIAKSAANADNVCLLTSSTGQISGNLVYVVAP